MSAATDLLAGCSTDGRLLRGCVAIPVNVTEALINLATSAAEGFAALNAAENELELAVPALLDSDIVLSGQMDENDAAISVLRVKRSGSGKVKVLFYNNGSTDTSITIATSVNIWVLVARK